MCVDCVCVRVFLRVCVFSSLLILSSPASCFLGFGLLLFFFRVFLFFCLLLFFPLLLLLTLLLLLLSSSFIG